MFSNKRNIIFFVIIGLSFLVALYPIYQRFQLEKNNRTVEIVYSSDDIDLLYKQTGVLRSEILTKFKSAGVTSIIIKEETIKDLISEGKVSFVEGSDIINNNRIFQRSYNQIFSRLPREYNIQPESSYLAVDENEIFEYIKLNMQIKFGENRVRDLGGNLLEIISPKEELMDLAVDINAKKAENINSLGFPIIPLFTNNTKFSEEHIGYKISRVNDYQYYTMLFNEDSVLGYPDYLDITILKLSDTYKMFGAIEFESPEGFQYLASMIPKNAIKVHIIDMKKENEKKYINQAIRAVIERNCRILYIRPYLDQKSMDLYDYNVSFIKTLKGTLEKKGYSINAIKNSPYKDISYNWIVYVSYLVFFIIGCICLIVFFEGSVVKPIIFGGVLYLGLIMIFYFTKQLHLLNEIFALGVAVLSPVLIYIYIERLLNKFPKKPNIKKYILILMIVFGGSLIASLFIRNLLYHSNYFLAIWIFRGVKIANFLPLVLLAIYFYIKPERMKYVNYVLKRYISQYLSIRFLVLVLILMLFFVFYILRTGNYGLLVFGNTEIVIRDFLQELFLVRPRTKEILFGYPLMILSIYFWNKRGLSENIKRGMIVFSSIASISMINTFCHIHSPVLISIYRSFVGLIIGSCIGVILILIYLVLNRFYYQKKIIRSDA